MVSENECQRGTGLWPPVDIMDIHDYLVNKTSYATRKQLKAHKLPEAYNYVTNGWVSEPRLKTVKSGILIMTEVNHSKSDSAQPLTAWVLVKEDGEVTFGHCTCMAGRGEVCSHTAAVLFYIEIGRNILENTSCTDRLNSWLPAHTRRVIPAPIAEMDFSSPQMQKRRLEGSVPDPDRVPQHVTAPKPTEQEWNSFFDRLIGKGLRTVCAGMLPRYSDLYVPAVVKSNASVLSHMQDPTAVGMDWSTLIQKCNDIADRLQIDDTAVAAIEKATRKQARAPQCYTYRVGRVTASNLRPACHTDTGSPSPSLIKRICYPQDHQFSMEERIWKKE